MLWLRLTRFEFAEDGITVMTPLRRTSIPWSWVREFALEQRSFPDRPETLRLIPELGRPIALNVSSLSDDERNRLAAWIPSLAANGWDRPRSPTPGPRSATRVRWSLYPDDLPAGVSAICFLVISVLAIAIIGRATLNDHRLDRRHLTSAGTVTAYDVRHGKNARTYASVTFSPTQDTPVRTLRREVADAMRIEHPVGSSVTIDYLPDDPEIARISKYDLAGRKRILLLFALPMLGMSLLVARSIALHRLLPLGERFTWNAMSSETVAIGNATLFSLHAALPDRH